MATYRKINEWKSHSRDVVESFKRYYHNSFLDSQRQEAYNLFLGNYTFVQGQPMLWDLLSDHYLHHSDPRFWSVQSKRDYINWFTPQFLDNRTLPQPLNPPSGSKPPPVSSFDDYWLEYYRPLAISSFVKIFSWKISSRPQYLHDGSPQEVAWNPSPFAPRKLPQEPDSPGKKARKGVTIVDPHNDEIRPVSSAIADRLYNYKEYQKGSARTSSSTFLPADKTQTNQWTMKQWHDNLINPSITAAEEEEYLEYVNHPLKLPLVISSEEPDLDKNPDFAAYLARGNIEMMQDGSDDGEMGISEENFADYAEFITVSDNPNPLTVTEEDGGRKRYKAYRQWLKGKSFFKQSKVDPEYRAQN
jgi:phosphatidylinositol 3,5-bisphosphate 5-phosphatase